MQGHCQRRSESRIHFSMLIPAPYRLMLRAEVNNLTGIIPDNFDATSHLRVFIAWGNALTGPIPLTLGTVPNLEVSSQSLDIHTCKSRRSGKVLCMFIPFRCGFAG